MPTYIIKFIDIPMLNAMYKVQMHAGAIGKLLYGFASVRNDNPLAKARGLSSLREFKQSIEENLNLKA